MSADVMRVRLHLRGVRVTDVNTPAELVVGVISVKKLSSCPFCGCSCQQVHDAVSAGSVTWRSAAAGRCCCGPSGGSCATIVGSGIWRPIPSSRVVSLGGWREGWSKTPR